MAACAASYNFGIIMLGRGMLGSCGSSSTLLCVFFNILIYFNILPTYTDTDAHNGHGNYHFDSYSYTPSDFVQPPPQTC